MKKRYLDLMERVVSAYSTEHIDRYTKTVREMEIREHGFPRLTANIGILMAHGRLLHLKDRFETMMEQCCRDIPTPCPTSKSKRGNDFSVREILLCILETERAGLFPKQTTDRWRAAMAKIDPYAIYRNVAPNPPVRVDNWAAFNAAGEQLRKQMGLADESDFIDNQIASQLLSFDENGMYRDPKEPMVYDIVPRGMLSSILFFGYEGKHKDEMDALLEKGGLCTLKMQSVTGELPFGGRSNQFLHNEAWVAAICEYEAVRYQKRGDMETAGKFRHAAEKAIANMEKWLDENGMFHVKNRFPIEETNNYAEVKPAPHFGCEKYAYYDKYMVTAASFLYCAYMFCDESIPCAEEDGSSVFFETGEHFHKVFVRCGGYFLEFEKDANPEYDASGLGRIHKKDAPGPICLSVPVSKEPNYGLDAPNPCPMAIAPLMDGEMAETCELTDKAVTEQFIVTQWLCRFAGGDTCRMMVSVSEKGVDIALQDTKPHVCHGGAMADVTVPAKAPDNRLQLRLPAFDFDGAEHTQIRLEEDAASIGYKGWVCRYEAGSLTDTGLICGNRNGKYRLLQTVGPHAPSVHITIERA